MNDPSYLAEHQIETSQPLGPGTKAIVISTASFTREEYLAMNRMRLAFVMYENFGAMRHVARFARHESAIREVDFYRRMDADVEARPSEWPHLHALVTFGSAMMTAPYSWALVLDDVHRYMVDELGVADDSALRSVLKTQHALLPAHGRRFPQVVPLDHDVVGWYRAMLAAKGAGHGPDWPEVVPRLSEFGPSEVTVDDPKHVCDTSLGLHREMNAVGVNWELESPLSRASIASTQLNDGLFLRYLSDQQQKQQQSARS
jgi:hypothetical protein